MYNGRSVSRSYTLLIWDILYLKLRRDCGGSPSILVISVCGTNLPNRCLQSPYQDSSEAI